MQRTPAEIIKATRDSFDNGFKEGFEAGFKACQEALLNLVGSDVNFDIVENEHLLRALFTEYLVANSSAKDEEEENEDDERSYYIYGMNF
jgi:flagellar biosynthesis/type III secretory pathway protein FliH